MFLAVVHTCLNDASCIQLELMAVKVKLASQCIPSECPGAQMSNKVIIITLHNTFHSNIIYSHGKKNFAFLEPENVPLFISNKNYS